MLAMSARYCRDHPGEPRNKRLHLLIEVLPLDGKARTISPVITGLVKTLTHPANQDKRDEESREFR